MYKIQDSWQIPVIHFAVRNFPLISKKKLLCEIVLHYIVYYNMIDGEMVTDKCPDIKYEISLVLFMLLFQYEY